jgi:hypothetical protein
MIPFYWLAAGAPQSDWCLIGKFSLPLAYHLQNPPANRTQLLVSEEMSQTLLTNKKKGKN